MGGVLCWPLFCYAVLSVLSSFSIIRMMKREREPDALLQLSYWCLVIVSVLFLFPTVPLRGVQCVIVIFPTILT